MKHESMGDEETTRSGLFYEAVRVIKEMRENDKRSGRADEFIRLYTDRVGALCARDFKGVGNQYVEEGKLIIEMRDEKDTKVGSNAMSPSVEVSKTLNCLVDPAKVMTVEPKSKLVVRRLTPTECTRLQGFPDGWVDIGEWTDSKGKVHKESDTPKYKALGNSICLPFWFYLLRRISAQYERPATLGSLFDGIGGFPLCWVRCNGIGSVLWVSEIEDFPTAVVRQHFGDEDLGIEGDIREFI